MLSPIRVALPVDEEAPKRHHSALRSALGRYPTGVTIVSAVGADSHVHCMTVNSFTSLSLDPPLVMWALRAKSTRYETMVNSSIFSVSVLAESQLDLARLHSTSPHRPCALDSWGAFLEGCPVIAGACAHFVCKSSGQVRQGDHTLLVGEISHFAEGHSEPLLFMSGGYYSGAGVKLS